MSNKLTGTDVRWIAKGHWEKYFYWRIYPRSRAALLIAAVLVAALLAMAVGADSFSGGIGFIPSGYIAAMWTLAGGSMAAMVFAACRYTSDKEDFIDECASKWEHGDENIPDVQSVKDYASRR